jgi:subtilase family serine protease
MRTSEAGQSVVFDDPEAGPVDLFDIPSGFAGRNLPDVSLNADPQTGYLVYWGAGGGLIAGIGGTSIVAPQLSGMNALAAQALGGRIGSWNPLLYRFKKTYRSSNRAPLTDVAAGDNWFYTAVAGYEPGAGLGTLELGNFTAAVRREGASH